VNSSARIARREYLHLRNSLCLEIEEDLYLPDRSDALVLHAISSGGLYGIERSLIALLPALNRAGQSAGLLCLGVREGEAGAVGRMLETLGVRVWYVPMQRGLRARDLLTIAKLLREVRPKLIHVHGYKAAAAVRLASFATGIPVVATVHSEQASVPELRTLIRIETLVFRTMRRLIAVSEGVARDLVVRGIRAQRTIVIHNGIEDPRIVLPESVDGHRAHSAGDPRVVVVGRLVEPKNVHVAIEALALLSVRGQRLTLEVIGEGPERERLEALAAARGVGGQVEFTGFVEDVPRRLQSARCFLMPSRSEGIPIAILEAMGVGLPIIASRVGGIPEILEDGRDAVLVRPDDAEALAEAIDRVCNDPQLADRMSEAARTRFRRDFEVESTRARHTEFYDAVLRESA
jgi:glycosyltransferase involved in cell wall biosynthesis